VRFVPPLVRVDQGGVKTHRLLADIRVQVDGVSQRMGKYGLVLGYNCLEVFHFGIDVVKLELDLRKVFGVCSFGCAVFGLAATIRRRPILDWFHAALQERLEYILSVCSNLENKS